MTHQKGDIFTTKTDSLTTIYFFRRDVAASLESQIFPN